jgi:hypothetical protein
MCYLILVCHFFFLKTAVSKIVFFWIKKRRMKRTIHAAFIQSTIVFDLQVVI